MSAKTDHDAAIAIVGMVCRFPGAANVEQFWSNLRDGVESVRFFSDEELAAAGADPELLADPRYVKAVSDLDDVKSFDAGFFGLTPREAEVMDPQQRLFLECSWQALENAGYDSQRYPGSIGLFAGTGSNAYLMFNLLSRPEVLRSVSSMQVLIGNDKDYLATRTSYELGLRGPSIGVQTACSTSLVAVHLGCQSLLDYQSDMVLAGGVRIRGSQLDGYFHEEGGILSSDGHTRSFDASASGTVFGSGVGVVVLKRLEDAVADGDHIRAVILGSAVNNDGSLKVGYTAPSVDGQMGVISEALSAAEVDPRTIGFVEGHGTATPLGDPIEVTALTRAFRDYTTKRGFCALGSVKSNLGHLDTAAGVAGLIKTVLTLEHAQIPPHPHFTAPNPQIDLDASAFYVNRELEPWATDGAPRRAGVSSFGIGGTNAHAILEEAPAAEPSSPSRAWQLLLLSAKSAPALEAATDNLAAHLERHPDLVLADVAATLQTGRRAFPHRRMLVCRDSAEATAAMTSRDPQRLLSHQRQEGKRSVAFLFPGQGGTIRQHGRGALPRRAGLSQTGRPLLGSAAAASEPRLDAGALP